ncbi:MAG: sulfur carrier protein [Frankiales bacterium]|jgi:sulfur carrier protein|nr:sulfur carrier protein [Frankiales bacterium]
MTTAVVNGERHELPIDSTLEALVRTLTERPTGVAVALNGDVVPRHAWAATQITDGDEVEVLTAVQGG